MNKILKEQSAGLLLFRSFGDVPQALLLRVRKSGYEIPKGHVEDGETLGMAARRELVEETNLLAEFTVGQAIGEISYRFEKSGVVIEKHVTYLAASLVVCREPLFGKRPRGTRELRWIGAPEVDGLELVNEDLRVIISRGFML